MNTPLPSRAARFGTPLILLHWLTVLLIIAVYALMEFSDIFPKGSAERTAMKSWHFTVGMTIFAVTWLRLLARLASPTPAIEPPLPRWQSVLSHAVEGLLYLLMIGLPLSGWLTVSYNGGHVWFWGVDLPSLASAVNKDTSHSIKEVHEAVANLGYALIGLHAVAALYHHYMRHDNTLLRMSLKG
ncbi:cytochrome b [Brachymonas sp. M4Q-1]|uniref:cytochrome b n=1 Tax=Brachymonas sp. M4Q-1 TaxID=3416906 RepID=UPI003CF4AC2A